MSLLRLVVRTPARLVLDTPVRRVVAEDQSGWFGVRAGCEDLVALLPAGLLVFEDPEGEGFVAVSGGLLDLDRGECHVLVGRATVSRDLATLGAEVAALTRRRRERAEAHRGVVGALGREAVRRLVRTE